MKGFAWDQAKNQRLQTERGVGFEEIVFLIQAGAVLDIIAHPDQQRYGRQRIFVVRRDNYALLVPFVESEDEIFLKTIIPSRKATRDYLGEETHEGQA